jgi:hypothetical protein
MGVKRLSPVVVGLLVLLVSGPAFAAGRAYGAPASTPTVTKALPAKSLPATTQTDPVKAAEEARAAALFQERFGQQVATVRATKDTYDDVALAMTLMAFARSSGIDDSYRSYLCSKTLELSLVDPKGYETAVGAAQLLSKLAPEKADACNDTIINIRQAQYKGTPAGQEKYRLGVSLFDTLMASGASKADAGNFQEAIKRYQQAVLLGKELDHPGLFDAEQQVAALVEQAQVAVLISQLTNMLKVDPNNRVAGDRMITAQLVDRDDPAEAAKYLREDSDPVLRKYIPAAAKGVDVAPELACVELADWYRRLAADTSRNSAKLAMLQRADGYYRRFLSLHKDKDAERTEADSSEQKVQAEIDRLSALAAGPPWNDCLKQADPTRDVLMGTWQKTEAGLTVSEEGSGKLALRLMPTGAYELEVKFVRDHGDLVGVALPVGNSGFLASLAGRDNAAPAESADMSVLRFGRPNPARETVNPALIGPKNTADGGVHTAVIRVQVILDQATISMTLDGKPLSKWTGPAKSLTSNEFPAAMPSRIWLVTNKAKVTFLSVRLRALSRQLVPVPSVGIPVAPAVATPTGG